MNSQKITENIVQLPSELVAQQQQLESFTTLVNLFHLCICILLVIRDFYYNFAMKHKNLERGLTLALFIGVLLKKEFLFHLLSGSTGDTAYNCFIRFIILLLSFGTLLFIRYSIKIIQQKINNLASTLESSSPILRGWDMMMEKVERVSEELKQKKQQLKDQPSKEKEEKEEQKKNPAQKEKEDIKIKENTWVPKAFIKQIFVAARNSARNLKQRRFFYNGTMRP